MMVIGTAVLVLVWSVLPFLMMFWASLMTESELVEGVVQIMDDPTVEHYERIFGLAETEAVFETKRPRRYSVGRRRGSLSAFLTA